MAATNVQAFPGDVTISSNLAVDTNTLFVDTVNSRVGIGTNALGAKLHVYENTLGTTAGNSTDIVKFGGGSGGPGALLLTSERVSNGSTWTTTGLRLQKIVDSTKMGYIQFGEDGDLTGQLIFGNSDATERMRITPAGFVGIGTNAPSARLHVKASGTGNPNVNGLFVYNPTSGSGDAIIAARVNGAGGDPYLSFDVAGVAGWAFGVDSSDSSKLKWSSNWDSLSAATKMTLDTSGKLGIGTDAPGAQLQIGPQDNDHLFLASVANNYGWILDTDDQGSGSVPFRIKRKTAGNDSIALTIKNDNGYVGIGSTVPAHPLVIQSFSQNVGLRLESGADTYMVMSSNVLAASYNNMTTAGDNLLIFSTDGNAVSEETDKGLIIAPHSSAATGVGIKICDTGRTHLVRQRNIFQGILAPSNGGRAQFVMHSGYSDLVIASSEANNTHGSTISFVAANPSDNSKYRKFVINQGNWGTRKQFLSFAYNDVEDQTNPHSIVGSPLTVMCMDGINKRVGIGVGKDTPAHTLDVGGNIRAQNLYMSGTELNSETITFPANTFTKIADYSSLTDGLHAIKIVWGNGSGGPANYWYGGAGFVTWVDGGDGVSYNNAPSYPINVNQYFHQVQLSALFTFHHNSDASTNVSYGKMSIYLAAEKAVTLGITTTAFRISE
jgi:hypothetical protein